MELFGRIERFARQNRGLDGRNLPRQLATGRFGRGSLLLAEIEDNRPVLASGIAKLAVAPCRIDHAPVGLQKLSVRNFFRIEQNLDRLDVAADPA